MAYGTKYQWTIAGRTRVWTISLQQEGFIPSPDFSSFGTLYAAYTPDSIVEDPSNSGQVLTWNDVSGLGHHLIQNVGTPLLSDINGVPAVSITGNTHLMRSASSFSGIGTSTHHCFIVGYTTDTSGDIFDQAWSDGFGAFRVQADTSNIQNTHAGSSLVASPSVNVSTEGAFLFDYRKPVGAGNTTIYFNGTSVGTGNVAGGPSGAMQIGRWVTNDGPIAKFGLVLLYGEDGSGNLPDAAPIRTAIMDYFGITP